MVLPPCTSELLLAQSYDQGVFKDILDLGVISAPTKTEHRKSHYMGKKVKPVPSYCLQSVLKVKRWPLNNESKIQFRIVCFTMYSAVPSREKSLLSQNRPENKSSANININKCWNIDFPHLNMTANIKPDKSGRLHLGPSFQYSLLPLLSPISKLDVTQTLLFYYAI